MENPGNALQEALTYGQLLTIKIENMKEQHRIAAEEAVKAKLQQTAKPQTFRTGRADRRNWFCSCCGRRRIKTLFSDLGCAHVVSGGQTMNPSTEDIVEAVLATPCQNSLCPA